MTYSNRKFNQCLSVIIESGSHDICLDISKSIRKQCDAWYFNVEYTEYKSSRKGPVLRRDLMIYQNAYSDDIIIFKEAIRRICFHFDLYLDATVKFIDKGSVPESEKNEFNYS